MSISPSPPMPETPSTGMPLVKTATGARLHIEPCPHILGCAVRNATPTEKLAMSVCTWCEAEINGVGRWYFDDLGDAMRYFGAHVGTEGSIRDALRFVLHDQVWVPNSKAYISLGLGGLAVAWVGKTYVVPIRGLFVELPGYHPHHGGGGLPSSERIGAVCTVHNVAMPLTGICDDCA
jgi:hypothetical protein